MYFIKDMLRWAMLLLNYLSFHLGDYKEQKINRRYSEARIN